MAGRPEKFSPEMTDALCRMLREGTSRKAAANAVGISHTTFARWLETKDAFRAAVEKAEAEAQQRFERIVVSAATDGTWQAAAWWLERRRKDDYALRQTTVHEGSEEAPVAVRLVRGG